MFVTALTGIPASISIYLAFVPPKAYVRMIAGEPAVVDAAVEQE